MRPPPRAEQNKVSSFSPTQFVFGLCRYPLAPGINPSVASCVGVARVPLAARVCIVWPGSLLCPGCIGERRRRSSSGGGASRAASRRHRLPSPLLYLPHWASLISYGHFCADASSTLSVPASPLLVARCFVGTRSPFCWRSIRLFAVESQAPLEQYWRRRWDNGGDAAPSAPAAAPISTRRGLWGRRRSAGARIPTCGHRAGRRGQQVQPTATNWGQHGWTNGARVERRHRIPSEPSVDDRGSTEGTPTIDRKNKIIPLFQFNYVYRIGPTLELYIKTCEK